MPKQVRFQNSTGNKTIDEEIGKICRKLSLSKTYQITHTFTPIPEQEQNQCISLLTRHFAISKGKEENIVVVTMDYTKNSNEFNDAFTPHYDHQNNKTTKHHTKYPTK